ncbi:DUF1648 domain-containing protein [Demequina rhizosphaerae]|uniref:DUF1648 domain-containing protein n=1 Tax=Demequina rhizosphaerae TaxID=1638985 RepID=UPI000783B4EE|nr:DUF1648 domain-containing protein [Demequina rhizosphaerae]
MDKAISRALGAGVVTPVVATAAAVAVELAVMGDLPDPVATHWGTGGPDGFSAAWTVPLMTALTAGMLPLILGTSALLALRRGERGFTLRLLPAVAAGLSVYLGALLAGTLVIQRGLETAQDAPGVGSIMLVALPAGAVVGVLAWLAQPRETASVAAPSPASPLALQPGERAVWLGRAEMTPWALAFIVLATLAAWTGAALMWLAGDTVASAIITGVAVLLTALAATFTVAHVRIDASGLTVTTGVRLVRLRVPAEDVASVAAIDVHGLAQYGGYGIRQIPGATAVVLRPGPAIEVARRSGRRFVVTVDDAPTAASLLAAAGEAAHAAQD